MLAFTGCRELLLHTRYGGDRGAPQPEERGIESRDLQKAGEGSEKVSCACLPSQIILTCKAREFDDIVKETNIMELDALRDQLDIIDERILSLLSERAQVIIQVADFKRQHNIPIYVPEREGSIIERLRTVNPGPLPGDTIERIYRNILEEMRKFESDHAPH